LKYYIENVYRICINQLQYELNKQCKLYNLFLNIAQYLNDTNSNTIDNITIKNDLILLAELSQYKETETYKIDNNNIIFPKLEYLSQVANKITEKIWTMNRIEEKNKKQQKGTVEQDKPQTEMFVGP